MTIIEHNVRYQQRPSATEMMRRWELAKQLMQDEKLDFLVTQANDGVMGQYVRWFAELKTLHITYLLFDKDGEISMISHGPMGGKATGFGVKLENNVSIPVFNNACYADSFAADEAVKIIQSKDHKKIGFIGGNLLTAGFYNSLVRQLGTTEFIDVTDKFDYLVAVKSDEELVFLQEACGLHDQAVLAIPSLVFAGRLEREFGADLYRLALIKGADEFLTNIMLASSRLPGPMFPLHYQNKIIEDSDCLNVLFEVPAMSGYYADVHRYFNIGPAAAELIEVMEGGVRAQDYVASICKPGVKASEVFESCNQWLADNGFESETRMCGHGQGYGLVERPYLDAFDPMELRENMYLAIHPTVKKNGAAVAIGDNFVVTKDGAKRLTVSPRELIII